MTATEKRFTAKLSVKCIQGVLFLTAGYGTRAEPLSFCRPKALLPWRDTTLLGNLIDQFAILDLDCMAFNASRCPELVLQEAGLHWDGSKKLLFEERPLGSPGTLARNSQMFNGHWIICNTDFVFDVPVRKMVDFHLASGSEWTVLTGDFPEYGFYGPLPIKGNQRHYLGISIVSPEIAAIAAREQLGFGFFSNLRQAAEASGIVLNEYFAEGEWLDMGEVHLFRKHLLSQGSYIHPSAFVHSEAILEGFYWIGSSCIIHEGARVRDSVLLEGSILTPGTFAVETVVPWFSQRS